MKILALFSSVIRLIADEIYYKRGSKENILQKMICQKSRLIMIVKKIKSEENIKNVIPTTNSVLYMFKIFKVNL